MDKEEFIKIFKNAGSYTDKIEGIGRFCDRWCERCAFTDRCTNYQLGVDLKLDENPDDWPQQVSMMMDATLSILQEIIEEEGIDLSEAMAQEADEGRNEEETYTLVNDTVCVKDAKEYAERVKEWLEAFENKDALAMEAYYSNAAVQNSLDVIRWYQYLIFVKLSVAVNIKMREDEDEVYDPAFIEADGFAKVALVAIDSSLGAWNTLFSIHPKEEDSILDMLVRLQRLQREVEKEFPHARRFIRPGLDE